ncbi:MAG TPA: condensation domain-containing protein, partial [Burkholderiaceae bacterium]|nr:condensation domain-containing protein [Burkholderiaceae bacterium]
MHDLAALGVRLELARDEVKVTAAQGVMSDALRQRLRQHKAGVVALLRGAADAPAGANEAVARSRPQDRYEPFPFSDLQTAFYMADNPYLEYHVRPHYYCEIEADGLDVPRYLGAVNKAIRHHAGEVAMVADDRHLKTLQQVPEVRYPVHDLRDLDDAAARERLARMRERLSRQPLALDRWPWFDLQVSLWREQGRERTRIHVNHNNFYTDGYGATVLQREIDTYYADPGAVLPPLQLTLRDAMLALEDLAASPAGERARRYWLDRLPHLPGPPELPQLPLNKRVRSSLRRREGYLDAPTWAGFKRNASACGLTPTGAVAATYAEILSAWSGSRHFVLSNMVTRRLPIHPDIMRIFGNFASLYPLEVDLRGDGSFAERALRLQQQMLRDAAHREWGGMQVMQAHNRVTGAQGTVPFPFVIGSGLFMEKYRKADFACLETAQTVMDHQFWE